MNHSFLDQLGTNSLRELLSRTSLARAALILVGPQHIIENQNEAGRALTELPAMRSIDEVLSPAAIQALSACLMTGQAQTLEEELDGIFYQLHLVPHGIGAALAYVRDDRSLPDGALFKLTACIGSALRTLLQTDDPQQRRQALLLAREQEHTLLLHEPPSTETVSYQLVDLAALCRDVAAQVQQHTDAVLQVETPKKLVLPLNERMMRMALYNLLQNAVAASPVGSPIDLTLLGHDNPRLTVADRGRGLAPERFAQLLNGWRTPMGAHQYISLQCGMGLPLARLVAELHGGSLLLLPRDGGGTTLHLTITRFDEWLAVPDPLLVHYNLTVDEMECSVF